MRRKGNLDYRKHALFAAACCRRVWHLLSEPESRALVEILERVALEAKKRKFGSEAEAASAAAGPATAAAQRLKKARQEAQAAAAAAAAAALSDPGWAASLAADAVAKATGAGPDA